MKIPDDIICIDTDTKDVYDKLTNYLHDKCLYDEESITESFTGMSKKLNLHFYFKIFDDDKISIKKEYLPNYTKMELIFFMIVGELQSIKML